MAKVKTLDLKRIAVTGGNGGLGKAIVNELTGVTDVVALDISIDEESDQWRRCDVTSLASLRSSLKGCDAIVHVAAMLQPEDPADLMFRVNVLGTWNVLTAARELGINKIVLMSSETASGIINITRVKTAKPEYLPIDEAHPLRPIETYGMSKQVGELMAESFTRDGELEVVVLRPTLILMPGWEDYVNTMRQTDDVDLWSYVVVWDVVNAVRLALELKGTPFSVFYLSAKDTFSTEPTLDFMQRKFGPIPDIRDQARYEENPYAAIWDGTKARDILGFEPEYDWRRFLAESGNQRQSNC